MTNYKAMVGLLAALAAAPVVGAYLERPAIEQRLTAAELRSSLEKVLAGMAEAADAAKIPARIQYVLR